MHIEQELLIHAPLETVWELTLRIEDLPSMSSTFDRVERLDTGPLAVGSRARITQPGLGTRTWTVTRLDPPNAFAWTTRIAGVRMLATHLLAAVPEGCRHTLALTLEGVGSGLLGRLAGQRMRASIETENQGMKRAAERAANKD